MLKACCDCIAAGTREENDVYGTQLNGNSLTTPLWPAMENQPEMTFLLPRTLRVGDKISITGVVKTDILDWFSIGLVKGHPEDNITGQIEFHFHKDNGKILTKTQKYGKLIETNVTESSRLSPEGLIKGILFPTFTITIIRMNNSLEFKVDESESGSVEGVDYNDINNTRFLIVQGDVKEITTLNFEFATTESY